MFGHLERTDIGYLSILLDSTKLVRILLQIDELLMLFKYIGRIEIQSHSVNAASMDCYRCLVHY